MKRLLEILARLRGGAGGRLDGVPRGLPALRRAVKLQQRAALAGFDWPGPEPVLDKIREELAELESEMAGLPDRGRLEDELGDLLFAVTNLARLLELDPCGALRRSNLKFERRFCAMEAEAASRGQTLDELDLDAMERLWREVKLRE